MAADPDLPQLDPVHAVETQLDPLQVRQREREHRVVVRPDATEQINCAAEWVASPVRARRHHGPQRCERRDGVPRIKTLGGTPVHGIPPLDV